MKAAQRTLFSLHNPTGTEQSFLLPLFTNHTVDNNLHIQALDFDDTVARFDVLTDDLPAQTTYPIAVAQLGAPAIHAFQLSAQEAIVGTRGELIPRLTDFLNSPPRIASPLQRFYLARFCGLTRQLTGAAAEAYAYLQTVSKYSADHWRDKTLLASAVRLSLARTLRDSKPLALFERHLDSIRFSLSPQGPRIIIPYEMQRLLTGTRWKSRLALDLGPYVAAFGIDIDELQLVVRSPTGAPFTVEDMYARVASSGRVERQQDPENARWLVAAFGKRSTSIANGLRGLSGMVSAPPERNNDWNRIFTAALERGGERPNLLIVLDVSRENLEEASEFLKSAPARMRPTVIGIHRTGEGYSGEIELYRDIFSQFVVLPDGEAPNSNFEHRIPLRRAFIALLGMLNASKPGTLDTSGISVFSTSYDRRGIRGAETAIRAAVAAAANELIAPSTIRTARIEIASVGRPDSEAVYSSSLQSCFSPLQPISTSVEWQQKSFLVGGSVGTTIDVLFSSESPRDVSQATAYCDAAQTIFRSIGFDVEEHGDNSFVVIGREGDRLQFVADPRAIVRDQLHVRVVEGRKTQLAELSKPHAKAAIPLTLNDLHFFKDATALRDAAQMLGILAHRATSLPGELHPIIVESLRAALRDRDRTARLIEQLRDRYPEAEITEIEITLESIKRVTGRTFQIVGGANVALEYTLDGGSKKSEDAVRSVFVGQISPAGVRFEGVRLA